MPVFDLRRRLAAEALGTAFLVVAVVGSGIMAETLTRDSALQLLCNALPTGAALVVLISILGPISGAHFNPAVSLVFAMRGELPPGEMTFYVAVQVAGGIAGAMIAHLMFDLPALALSTKLRAGNAQWLAEAVAAFGLLVTILGGIRFQKEAVPWLVGLYITSAYWFTASTSFANPAVTIARMFTNSFSGIAPHSVPPFILSQCAGALVAGYLARWLFRGSLQCGTERGMPSSAPAE
jgi:glycerol uptake facilitator-like aquaporin